MKIERKRHHDIVRRLLASLIPNSPKTWNPESLESQSIIPVLLALCPSYLFSERSAAGSRVVDQQRCILPAVVAVRARSSPSLLCKPYMCQSRKLGVLPKIAFPFGAPPNRTTPKHHPPPRMPPITLAVLAAAAAERPPPQRSARWQRPP